jgi:hypothetical protein
MKTTIEAKTVKTTSYIKVQIVSVQYGFSQTLQDGQWVNTTSEPQRFETEILTLGKYFESSSDTEKFMQTKAFKNLLKQVQKGDLI